MTLSFCAVPRNQHPGAWLDGTTLGDWATEVDGADVVINLAGRSINCRYTPENRKLIHDSRIASTQVIGEAIARAAQPLVWVQSSTATIYAHRFDAPNDELTGMLGGLQPNIPESWRFSVDVATAWAQAADEAAVPNTRVIKMCSAVIMSILARFVKMSLANLQ